LSHSNVLDVSHKPEIMDELALDDERTRADDARRGVEDAKQVVRIRARRHPCVALVLLLDTSVCEGFESRQGKALYENRKKHERTSSVISPTVVKTLSTSKNPFS